MTTSYFSFDSKEYILLFLRQDLTLSILIFQSDVSRNEQMELDSIIALAIIILVLAIGLICICKYFRDVINAPSLNKFYAVQIGFHKDDVINCTFLYFGLKSPWK